MKEFLTGFIGLTLTELIFILPTLLIVKILLINGIIPAHYFNAEDIILFKALFFILLTGNILGSIFVSKCILQ